MTANKTRHKGWLLIFSIEMIWLMFLAIHEYSKRSSEPCLYCYEYFFNTYLYIIWIILGVGLLVFLGFLATKLRRDEIKLSPRVFFALTLGAIGFFSLSPSIYGYLEIDHVVVRSMWTDAEGIISMLYFALLLSMFYTYAFMNLRPRFQIVLAYIIGFIVLFFSMVFVMQEVLMLWLSDNTVFFIFIVAQIGVILLQFVTSNQRLAEIGRVFMFFFFPFLPMLTHFALDDYISKLIQSEALDAFMLLTPFVLFPLMSLKKTPVTIETF